MVVQKFGGTSVADPDAIRRLVAIVRTARDRSGRGPAVVVSAMSGVTDALLAIAARAAAGSADDALAQVDELRARHLAAARELVSGPDGGPLVTALEAQLEELTHVVRTLGAIRETSPGTQDAIAAVGELLSSRLVAAALTAAGVPATWVDARQAVITNDDHTRATPMTAATDAAMASTVRPVLDAGRVPVLGGFVGATADGRTTTLGRGGSDYSGALVGAAIGADEIQIWTDVDGMLTADPRVISGPRLVPTLSFAEAAELAYFGAKVLHPSTILPAVERNIPVRILNSRRPEGAGTLITAEGAAGHGSPVTALACKRGLVVIDITSSRMLNAYGFLRKVFETFERFHTPVDVVTTSEVSISTTIDANGQLEALTEALRAYGEVSVEREMALLCAVGDRLRQEPALGVRVVRALEDTPLRMISQAASRRNITVVLRQADLPSAMQRLHEDLFA